MNKRNVIITIISVLLLVCLFAFARTTTTDLGLVKPIWEENLDILDDINANSDILEAFANDVLEHDLSPVLRAPLDISTFDIEGVDATEFGFLDGVTSDIQDQFGLRYLKTETDALSEWETIWSKDITDSTELASALTDYYLKAAINTQGKMEAIWGVDLATDTELAALKFTDLDDTPAAYDTGKYAKSTVDGVVWDTPAGGAATTLIGLTDTPADYTSAANKFLQINATPDAVIFDTIVDGDIPNGITIDLATLATTFTATDNESEDLACLVVFVDGATGAQDAETDGDLTYNPSTGMLKSANVHFGKFDATVPPDADNDVTEGYVVGSIWVDVTGDRHYTCLDNTTGDAIWSAPFTMWVRADEAIKKGDPVYISGAQGSARPKVKLVDADLEVAHHMIGAAVEDIGNGADGFIRTSGAVKDVDTEGNTDANPGDEDWAPGDHLYCTRDGGGGYTNIRPTSGMVILAAFTLLGDHDNDSILVVANVNDSDMAAAVGEDIRIRLGADDGTTWIIIKNFSDTTVASIDDQGDADFNSLILDTALPVIEGGTGKDTITADSFLKGAAGNTYVERTYGEVKQDLDLEIGTDVQAYSANNAFRTDKLDAFAATTEAELYAVLSDVDEFIEAGDAIERNYYSLLDSNQTYSDNADTDSWFVGETVAFGELLYFDWGVKRWKKAKADFFATTPAMRIALEGKVDGETCLMLIKGYIRDDALYNFGAARVFLNDDTAGTCDDTAPSDAEDQIQIVGTALSADILFFDPSEDVGEI